MQPICIAIRWKTAFHPEATLLFQGDVLPHRHASIIPYPPECLEYEFSEVRVQDPA